MTDKERVVHQGLGWFLREAWKRYPEPVEEFLMKWKDTAARLIFQYATEKMSKEYREKFRRTKK
jgi:3-methyladenine DNA glycosylase AlkD